MARLDVQTLVMAFEKRIEALEKNPPDKISTGVVLKILDKAIEEEIKNHFLYLVKKEIEEQIREEFKKMKVSFVNKTVKDMLSDEEFRIALGNKIKRSVIRGIGD